MITGKKYKIIFPQDVRNKHTIVCLSCLDQIFPHKFEGHAFKKEQKRNIAVLMTDDDNKCTCCDEE